MRFTNWICGLSLKSSAYLLWWWNKLICWHYEWARLGGLPKLAPGSVYFIVSRMFKSRHLTSSSGLMELNLKLQWEKKNHNRVFQTIYSHLTSVHVYFHHLFIIISFSSTTTALFPHFHLILFLYMSSFISGTEVMLDHMKTCINIIIYSQFCHNYLLSAD